MSTPGGGRPLDTARTASRLATGLVRSRRPLSQVPLSQVPLSRVPLSRVPLSQVPLDACHIASHQSLVREPLRWPRLPEPTEWFDAIIVPAAREGINLQHAAAVARRAGRSLIVFYSHECRLDEAIAAITANSPRVDVFLVDARDLSSPYPFTCDQVLDPPPWPNDTSAKRNAGLALCRAMGWTSALFLDDDVRQLRGHDLRRALGVLRSGGGTGLLRTPYRVAGWTFPDFPDNSVVCHAYRELPGPPRFGPQGTFVGGGGLALRIEEDMPFFPRVYNEDWLFLYPYLRRNAVALMGRLAQQPYEPFGRAGVAAQQEFGDLLGEGLFHALHRERARLGDADECVAGADHWKRAIDKRSELLQYLDASWALEGGRGERVRACLAESQGALSRVQADVLTQFVSCWARDQARWRLHLGRLEVRDTGSVEHRFNRALAALALPEAHRIPATGRRPPRPPSFPRRRSTVDAAQATGLAGQAAGPAEEEAGLAAQATGLAAQAAGPAAQAAGPAEEEAMSALV